MVPGPHVVGAVAARTCPLCHTPAVVATALDTDEDWTCVACGQDWDTKRMERVASYAAYVATHSTRAVSFTDGVPARVG